MNATRTRRAAIYVRVSTDRQTVENQVAKLTEVAKARGWQIVATFTDAGISGAKKDRPGLDDMLKQTQRGTFDVVMAWAIDRVGRSLIEFSVRSSISKPAMLISTSTSNKSTRRRPDVCYSK